MTKIMHHLPLLISFFIWGFSVSGIAQNAPITTCAWVSGVMPGPVNVAIIVTGFNNIGAVSLSLDYDYSVIHFVQGMPNPALAGFLSGDMDLGNGNHRISMGWFGSSATLPDGSTIMTLNFDYLAGNAALTWFDNGSSCEYADPLGNQLNDIPASTYFINGYVCGGTGNPGTISGNNPVCQGQSGEVYSIAPLANVTGYTWTVPAGAVIAGGQNTNSIVVDFLSNAASGNITVCGVNPCGNGPVSQVAVTVNQLPYANAGNDTTINYGTSTTLHAAPGGTGTFSYHWSPEALLVNPFVQNPQTVILTTTTQFNLVVTNPASSCHSDNEMVVAITGGPLSINPSSVPASICAGDYAQLNANAGGGSGSYTYTWTCVPPGTPPWSSAVANPLVSPTTPTLYQLSVSDGFTTVNGSVNLTVKPLPTATISGGDTLCGTGNSALLEVDLTGTPPWSFTYTNGINSVTIFNQYTTPYYIITGNPGIYTLPDIHDLYCSGTTYGSATVNVFPVPATPTITMIDYTLISSVCCGNQWYLNNAAIPGATAQSYTASASGTYFDIITRNSCTSDTSEIVGLIVGLDDHKEMKFSLSPNPTSDMVNLHFGDLIRGAVNITITTSDGRVAGRYDFNSQGELHEISMDVSDLRPGLYFVTLTSGEAVNVKKLIVR